MSRIIRRISTLVYGLGIVAALAFGANQALGRPVYAFCIYHFPILGACANTGDTLQDRLACIATCNNYNPPEEYPLAHCGGSGYCCECTL
jgi:hypothetical protein